MANELTYTLDVNLSISSVQYIDRLFENITVNISNKKTSYQLVSIGTSEEAMVLGETSGALGYCLIRNRDSTNFVQVRASSGGTAIIKILPGKLAWFQFGSGVTAPYLIADTAACDVEYWIIST